MVRAQSFPLRQTSSKTLSLSCYLHVILCLFCLFIWYFNYQSLQTTHLFSVTYFALSDSVGTRITTFLSSLLKESTFFFFFVGCIVHVCITCIHQTCTRIIYTLVLTHKNVVVASVNLQDSRAISIEVFVMILAWKNL